MRSLGGSVRRKLAEADPGERKALALALGLVVLLLVVELIRGV